MLKLNKTPRMKESAETTRWYMDIASAVNQLVDGVALKGANSDITSLTGLVGPGLVPVGSVIFHGSTTLPSGYLKANGALISRTTYAALFTAIGTTFGVGDGSTTFALPDLRAEFIRGLDDGRGIDTSRAIGSAQAFQTKIRLSADGSIVAGNLDFVTGGATTFRLETNGSFGGSGVTEGTETRPRNVALLACIKY